MASLVLRIEGMYCDHCAQTVAHAIGALAGTGVNAAFGYNVFNAIPAIDATIPLGMLVVTGVMTSLRCVSMCGAVNLAATTDAAPSRSASRTARCRAAPCRRCGCTRSPPAARRAGSYRCSCSAWRRVGSRR